MLNLVLGGRKILGEISVFFTPQLRAKYFIQVKCLIKISQLFLSGQSNKDMTIGNIIIILQILTLSPNQFRNKFCNSHFLESAVDVFIN